MPGFSSLMRWKMIIAFLSLYQINLGTFLLITEVKKMKLFDSYRNIKRIIQLKFEDVCGDISIFGIYQFSQLLNFLHNHLFC